MTPVDATPLLDLAATMARQGRFADAVVLFEHLRVIRPRDLSVVRGLATAYGGEGRTLEALGQLAIAREAQPDAPGLLQQIQAVSLPAVEKFNAQLAAGRVDLAEPYAAALVALAPGTPSLLAAALACNQALDRPEAVIRYAAVLLGLEPNNAAALAALGRPPAAAPPPATLPPADLPPLNRVFLDPAPAADPVEAEIAERLALALAQDGHAHPLIQLRDLHDVASQILCRPLTPTSLARLATILPAAAAVSAPSEPGSEWEAWEKHYRLLLAAVDLDAVRAPTPSPAPEPDLAFVSAAGKAMDWAGVAAAAKRIGAQTVFFAAADEAYVELYARWYALSVLKYCDVPCLVVVHVIGGAQRLKAIAKAVGVKDKRLIFCGDDFDASAVTTKVYDAPPKGLIAVPVAHFQSVRFLRLGALLRQVGLPVFVSDIDLLLQRGVADLLSQAAQADVVFNENILSAHAGSRLTANLLLVKPSPAGLALVDFLRAYLERVLDGAEVTRWIDQVALMLGRHHLAFQVPDARIAYFDTETDINNVMYTSYEAHPFRFLSLYHGFDTSSLEGDPRVLGESST